jgi:hypothetical protein
MSKKRAEIMMSHGNGCERRKLKTSYLRRKTRKWGSPSLGDSKKE